MIWEKAGPENTDNTIKLAVQTAKEKGIKHLVVASYQGETIKKTLEYKEDLELSCVTHHVGFRESGMDEMEQDIRDLLQSQGVKILTATHLLAGVDRAVRNQFGGVYPAEIMAQTLRIFGQGVKVAVEIAVMALDAGMIPYGEDIIAIGGSSRGADAAIVIRPAHSNHFFDSRIRNIICMPQE